MTASHSKSKTGKHHPYYHCDTKGCPSKGKSIRKTEVEGKFEALLQSMRPSEPIFEMIQAMFKNAWEQQRQNGQVMTKTIKRSIAKCETQITQLLDRIVDASSDSVVKAYDTRIAKPEREKLALAERLSQEGKPKHPFGEMFELTMHFLLADFRTKAATAY